MSCKTVSKAMGCYRLGNAAPSMGLLAGVLDRNPGDVAVDSITRKEPLLGLFYRPPGA